MASSPALEESCSNQGGSSAVSPKHVQDLIQLDRLERFREGEVTIEIEERQVREASVPDREPSPIPPAPSLSRILCETLFVTISPPAQPVAPAACASPLSPIAFFSLLSHLISFRSSTKIE
jgi:hypothetical protein